MPLEIVEALQQEELANALVQRLREEAPHHGVLEPACVLVQNAGLGRWLQLWHARKSRISAGVTMPFARSFIAKTLDDMGLYDRRNSVDEDRMQWAFFSILVSRRFEDWGESGQPLRAYLDGAHPNLEQRCWQLAGQTAELFDQYAIYRPQWLQEWLTEPGATPPMAHWGWQARLFGAVMDGMGLNPEAMARRIFGLALHRFHESGGAPQAVSRPLHVFGVNSFSPAFLKFFHRLAETRPVTVYHLVCSEAFLGDLPKNYRQALLDAGDYTADTTEMPEMMDNPYLVANGQATARFQSLLLTLDYSIGGEPSNAGEDVTNDLGALQHSLRQNEGTTEFQADGSVSFHSCHSRMREVQVLQQQLLALFAADPDLRPEDILVLMPEISEYADAVETVFGQGAQVDGKDLPVTIPYCIADRHGSEDENCWRFFAAFLELLRGRQAFSEVAGLLDFDPVCERLQMSRDEMQELLSILQTVGVRWGIDGRTRALQRRPEFEAYSWDYGLQRLYDGLLLPQAGQDDCAPYPVPGRMAEIVGNLTQLLRPAFEFVRKQNNRQSFSAWVDALVPVLRGFTGEQSGGSAWAGTLIPALGNAKEVSADVEISFDTFCEILRELKQEVSGSGGLLRRGMTFCRLQPARHIPRKVICILGMNEGAYPRRERRAEFDLINLQRRKAEALKGGAYALTELHFLGDHRLRDEDRQLFLDCILNARERLYISYVGQSDKSNVALPPSLLVSELQQFLRRAPEGAKAERADLLEQVIVRHPLQEWSRMNFIRVQPRPGEPPAPIHFETELATLRDDQANAPAFMAPSGANAVNDEEFEPATEVDTKELLRFFKDPAKYYLKQRLLVDVDPLQWEEIHEDRENLEMDGLQQWQFRECLVKEWLSNAAVSPDALKKRLELDLTVPPGLAGKKIWATCAEPLFDCMSRHLEGETLEKEPTERWIGRLRFSDTHWKLRDGRRLILLNGDLKPKYLLEAYLRNIDGPMGSVILCLSDQNCFDVAAADAAAKREEEAWLSAVLDLWTQGQQYPLPFSLEIASEYVKAMAKDASTGWKSVLGHAYSKAWKPARGASDDSPAQRLCFNGDSPAAPDSPWEEAFAAHAETILAPVLKWAEIVKEGKRG